MVASQPEATLPPSRTWSCSSRTRKAEQLRNSQVSGDEAAPRSIQGSWDSSSGLGPARCLSGLGDTRHIAERPELRSSSLAKAGRALARHLAALPTQQPGASPGGCSVPGLATGTGRQTPRGGQLAEPLGACRVLR